jgi:hypothetical protein
MGRRHFTAEQIELKLRHTGAGMAAAEITGNLRSEATRLDFDNS